MAAGVCFAVPTLTRSVTTLEDRHPAGAAASLAFIKRGFVIRVGITVKRSYIDVECAYASLNLLT